MFCKSGILIFIFAENNYLVRQYIYMPTPCWLKHLCSIRALVPVSFFLSFSLSLSFYFWLILWSAKAGCVTQGILASFLFSLSHCQLRTTRFWSIKGPTCKQMGCGWQLNNENSYPEQEKTVSRSFWELHIFLNTSYNIYMMSKNLSYLLFLFNWFISCPH